ncbi:MAG: hypothetical protein HY769_08975 [Candidatus Stahlbacteria bacterium]|nr:hypothetical protein [Candidatus Stahlbacteria bacterium]
MRKLYLCLSIVILCGCNTEPRADYNFMLSVTNNTSVKLYIVVTSEGAQKELGWVSSGETYNFQLVEVFVPQDDPDPVCTLLAKPTIAGDSIYARETVKLKETTHKEWAIN